MELKSNPELYAMMQIAADKHCWLADLDNIPGYEFSLWLAYYELEEKRRKIEARQGGDK